MLFLYNELLRNSGYKTYIYDNPKEFYYAYIEKSIVVDMIITDINMPNFSGIELITNLIKQVNMKSIPVIFLTGKMDDITIYEAFENNILFLHYLLKPINFTLLLMTIQKMFLLKDYSDSINEANERLINVIKILKERQLCAEKIIEKQQYIYNSEQETLFEHIQEISRIIESDKKE